MKYPCRRKKTPEIEIARVWRVKIIPVIAGTLRAMRHSIKENLKEEEKEKETEGEEEEWEKIQEGAPEMMAPLVKPAAKEIVVKEEPKKVFIPYEKIDWNKYLSETEKQYMVDPALRAEMEKYIEERKHAIEEEQRAYEEKRERRLRYIETTDPDEILRNENLVVTMKFILNSGDTYTNAFKYLMKFRTIKYGLSQIFKVPAEVFIIYRDEIEIQDDLSAYDLIPEVEPNDTITLRLLTLDNDRWRLKSDFLELPVPDIITCTVVTGVDCEGAEEKKEIVVEIENRKIKKPFVGGYVDCETGIEYHHAFSQSGPRPTKIPWEKQNSRDTQTAFIREKSIDTLMDKSTQMARRDYYVSTEYDKIMTAKPYVDYDTWMRGRDVENKTRIIQRYIRAMIMRRYLKKMSEEYKRRRCWELEQERKRVLERENRIKTNIINMTYPKTRADFDMLYAMVEKWRKTQVDRISKLKTEAPKKAELCAVLEKEIKLLEAIEVHRIAVCKKQKEIKNLKFMEKVSAPVTWTGYRGMTVKMDTLKTQRARELKELYHSLSRQDLNYEDRIELLISLKHALRMQTSTLTEELISLINQECEMIVRGVKAKDLDYLRQRIEFLFQEYFKDPYFNPEMAKYDPTFCKDLLRGKLFCRLCHTMKSLKDFSVSTRDKSINVCSSCQWVHNIAIPRIDLSPYRYILKMVRKDEQKRNCYSSCAFVLQDEDMRFLVQNIWKGRSAISESDDLIDLRMPRWDVTKDWTPWNCILLTELEAKAHLKTKPSDNYEPLLTSEIISKHELAKRHFQPLFSSAKRIRDTGKWANTVDVKDYRTIPLTADFYDIRSDECFRLRKNGRLYDVHETRRKDDGYVQYV